MTLLNSCQVIKSLALFGVMWQTTQLIWGSIEQVSSPACPSIPKPSTRACRARNLLFNFSNGISFHLLRWEGKESMFLNRQMEYQLGSMWLQPRNGIVHALIIIRHKCIYTIILQLTSLLVYNGYYGFNKAGLPQAQPCMFYLYPQFLQPRGVFLYRSGSSTRFTLYICNRGHRLRWMQLMLRL